MRKKKAFIFTLIISTLLVFKYSINLHKSKFEFNDINILQNSNGMIDRSISENNSRIFCLILSAKIKSRNKS